MQTRKRTIWGTRYGFYLAAIGTAFGLGNLWRFPYVVAENGGGAFVLLYTFLALFLGMPLLIGELMLGKLTRRSAIVGVHKVLSDPILTDHPNPKSLLKWVGRIAIFSTILVLSYYAVISGWVLHFLMQFIFGELHAKGFSPERALTVLYQNGLLQVALASAHLLIVIVVVVKGVQNGIERAVGAFMPLFAILLLLLIGQSLSLPSSGAALRFLFYPDFSKLTLSSLLYAIGHICFTLSIGFGTMVTFGSYLSDDEHVPTAALRVTALDTMLSLFAGLLIFPIIASSSMVVSGPDVLFQTLPRLFLNLENGFLFGVAFFLCLYLAALGASIGLLETIVSNLIDRGGLSRAAATWIVGVAAFCLAVFPALSTSVLENVRYQGRGLLEIVDAVVINGLLPLTALGLAFIVSKYLRQDLKKREFVNDESMATDRLFSHWSFVVKWVAPILILGALALEIISLISKVH